VGQGAKGGSGIVALGVLLVTLAVICVFLYGRPERGDERSPLGIALIAFGLLFAALTTIGRSNHGLSAASQNRYAAFDLLVPVGCYLTLLSGPSPRRRLGAASPRALVTALVGREPRPSLSWSWQMVSLFSVWGLLLFIVTGQFLMGTGVGLKNGPGLRLLETRAAQVTAHIDQASDALVRADLVPAPVSVKTIRDLAHLARARHLSFFNTAEAATYARAKLPIIHSPPVTQVVSPAAGATVRGDVFLTARAFEQYNGVKAVEFVVTSLNGGPSLTIPAANNRYGWLGAWRTARVPDGSFSIQSVALNTAGDIGRSRPVIVTVDNSGADQLRRELDPGGRVERATVAA
jgi:Bacterial Ig domain